MRFTPRTLLDFRAFEVLCLRHEAELRSPSAWGAESRSAPAAVRGRGFLDVAVASAARPVKGRSWFVVRELDCADLPDEPIDALLTGARTPEEITPARSSVVRGAQVPPEPRADGS
jgi:hypothetical protein